MLAVYFDTELVLTTSAGLVGNLVETQPCLSYTTRGLLFGDNG